MEQVLFDIVMKNRF